MNYGHLAKKSIKQCPRPNCRKRMHYGKKDFKNHRDYTLSALFKSDFVNILMWITTALFLGWKF